MRLRDFITTSLVAALCFSTTLKGEVLQSARESIKSLDDKAASMTHPDSKTTAAYVSAVLQNTAFSLSNAISVSRCVRTEQDYRTGLRGAVTEDRIALALNNLLSKLAVPGSNKVSETQIHMLRVQMLVIMPHMMASPTRTEDHIITNEITPTSALYLASLLLEQKMLNPMYQKTPED